MTTEVSERVKYSSHSWGSFGVRRARLRLFVRVLTVEYDADEVTLVLLHVFHQPLLTGRLQATDAAAEEQHAVLHAATVRLGRDG